MARKILFLATFSAMACMAQAQTTPREPTNIAIRRMAGLPAEIPVPQIEIIDVGHNPLAPMIDIVANRVSGGWAVTYACAQSPLCAEGKDHLARTYVLPPAQSAEIDGIIAGLKGGSAPDNTPSSPTFLGGWANVAINVEGLKRQYDCTVSYGTVLGRLHELLAQSGS